jgi:hypothetical protein
MAEDWTAAPLLRLDLFRNRASGIASIASVIGMFCFLGTAYSTTIRLTVILGFTPLPAAPPRRRLSCRPLTPEHARPAKPAFDPARLDSAAQQLVREQSAAEEEAALLPGCNSAASSVPA